MQKRSREELGGEWQEELLDLECKGLLITCKLAFETGEDLAKQLHLLLLEMTSPHVQILGTQSPLYPEPKEQFYR